MVNETERRVTTIQTYPFEITMNNPEFVEVGHARCDPAQLRVAVRNGKSEIHRKTVNGLTNSKRFIPGLDLAYSTTSPFFIQGETIRKE